MDTGVHTKTAGQKRIGAKTAADQQEIFRDAHTSG